MKMVMVTVLSLVTGLSAHAAGKNLKVDMERLVKNQGATYFEALKQLVKNGDGLSMGSVKDVAWSGRCYLDTNQNFAINSGHIFKEKKGQLFEGYSYNEPRAGEEYFDDMSVKEVFEWNSRLIPYPANDKYISNGIRLDYPSNGLSSNDDFSILRSYGNSIIEEKYTWAKVPGRLVMREKVDSYCYYFKVK